MRTRLVKLCGWLAVGGSLAFSARADNGCIENPSYGTIGCLSTGTLASSYVLAPTLISVCVSNQIPTPTVTNLAMINGWETNYVTYICRPSGLQTNSIPYTFGNLFFVPPIPQTNRVAGTNYYTAEVVAYGGPFTVVTNRQHVVTTNALVTVTNILGPITNIVSSSPPVIQSQPASQTVFVGDNVTFSVSASSCPCVSYYQWWFNGAPLSGATNTSFTITDVRTNNAGNYSVVVSDIGGAVTNSPPALLTVQIPPYAVPCGFLTGFTFQADTTYYINGTVTLGGTTTIEGGTVIKFSTNGSLVVTGPLVCKTGPYRPALLTSKDDNSAGLTVNGSSGHPSTATNGLAYLNIQGWPVVFTNGVNVADVTVHYLRFAYADKGLAGSYYNGIPLGSGSYYINLHVWDCQFVSCNWGVGSLFNVDSHLFDLHNVLFAGCQYSLGGGSNCVTTIYGEQLTSSNTASFWNTNYALAGVSLTNSIILGGFQFGASTSVTTNVVAVNLPGTVFQPVGGAKYYLAVGSPYQKAGTTNISPALRAELAQKTTYPPNCYNFSYYYNTYYLGGTIGTTTLSPQVPRDTNSTPDLGYHYDPLDYLFGPVTVANNSTIIATNGVAIAFFAITNSSSCGLAITNNSHFLCQGAPNNLNRVVEYNTVQETTPAGWLTTAFALVGDFGGANNVINCRFTDWSVMAQDTAHIQSENANDTVAFQDCQFHGGQLITFYPTINLTNCLLERVYVDLEPQDDNIPVMRNNLVYGGTFDFYPVQNNSVVKDNLFDHTVIPDEIGAAGYTYDGGHNAYVTNCDRLDPGFPSDIILSNALLYQAGPLGNYYQPGNSQLINQGSTTADQVGLYHYTVITNLINGLEIKETNSIVDIGYHYVAVDCYGNLIDSDSDGIPDYFEDSNGDGVYDAGDSSDWTDYYNYELPYLTIVMGDGQSGPLNAFLPQPLVVQVTYLDDYWWPHIMTNAPITFSVTNGVNQLAASNGGTLVSNLFLKTDSNGCAQVYLYLPANAPPTNLVLVTAQSDIYTQQIAFTAYETQAAAPVFSPMAGTFTVMPNVAISSATPGATIHYTINGQYPTDADPALANGQSMIVPWTTTVKAVAFDDAILLPSDVRSASFTLIHPLVAGRKHTLILTPGETILAGGSNGRGQLGDGTFTDRTHLVGVLNLTNAAGVSAGALHSLAWTSDGTAWAWGDDTYGQLGDNGNSGGLQSSPIKITGLNGIVQMAGGYQHSLALDSNSVVYVWGNNDNGQLGDGMPGFPETTPERLNGLSYIVAIAAGGTHSLALVSNETVFAWGDNTYGQIGDGTTDEKTTPVTVVGLTNALAIAAGYNHSLALVSNETVYAWGDNTYGQIGNGTTGTTGEPIPIQTVGLSNIVAIAAGEYHNLALKSDGTVWAWGYNSHGQLGDGTTTTRTTPVPVSGLSNVLAIAAGWAHSAALKSDGTVVIWGSTNYGLNGDSSIYFSTVPVTNEPSVLVDWSPLTIITQPFSQEVQANDSVTFNVVATGVNLTYQWTFNGSQIPGATASSYTITNAQPGNAGNYAVIVGAGLKSVGSANAVLTVDTWLQDCTSGEFSWVGIELPGGLDPFLMSIQGPRLNYTFKSGVTYYIWEPVQLYGNTTIEGGAVIKFDYSYSNATLQVMGQLNCQTEPYNPAILTCVHDNSSGEWIYWMDEGCTNGYQPVTPSIPSPFLDLAGASNSSSISNLRIAYADEGVTTPVRGRLDVWDCQFLDCNSSIMNQFVGTNGLHNVLFSYCGDAVHAGTNTFAITAEHVTADVANFWDASTAPSFVGLTNSIVLGGLGAASLQNTEVNPSTMNFQAADAGNYYLAPDSTLHGSGTLNVSPQLLAEFKNKTTYPPVDFPALMKLTSALTLCPQAQRYTNGAPDLGYYYDALDYTVACMILNGGTLTILPGTAIGCRMDFLPNLGYWGDFTYIGFDVWENSAVISQGTPTRPNIFVDVQSVQEQFEWAVMGLFTPDYYPPSGESAQSPYLNFRFSNFYLNYATCPSFELCSGPAYHLWSGISFWCWNEWSPDSSMLLTLQDCKFHGGQIDVGWPDYWYGEVYAPGVVAWTNNSFENVSIEVGPSAYMYNGNVRDCDVQFTAFNNLFRNCDWFFIYPIPAASGGWAVKDNLFDKVEFWQDHTLPLLLDLDYNAYWRRSPAEVFWGSCMGDTNQMQPTIAGGGTHEVVLTSAPPYQTNFFGNYYMPTTTPLYGAGSTTAGALGLYHYTTRVDQTKEGDDTAKANVNIGVHYVAADLTTGLPKDSDGDGIPDYVEDANGNGVVDANETDWRTQYTVSGIWDPTNSVYDNIDLSGDGLVGRIKKALGMSPFDKSNPLTLTQVGGNNQNIITFELPINYNVLTNIGNLSLNIDVDADTLEGICPAQDNNTLINWSSTYNTPGQHYLQAQLTVKYTGNDADIITAVGPVIPFYSANLLQFFESGQVFNANGAYLQAQLTQGNANYTIQIFDPSTTPSTLINTIAGSTTKGLIQEAWGLTNSNRTPFTGNTFTAIYNVTIPGGSGASKSSVHIAAAADSGSGGSAGSYSQTQSKLGSTEVGNGFDFGYMYTPPFPLFYAFMGYYSGNSGIFWQGMQNVVDTLLSPATADFGTPYNYNSGFNFYTYEGNDNLGYGLDVGYSGYINDTGSRKRLTNDMTSSSTQVKNFFMFAHGGQYDLTSADCVSADISTGDISSLLGNEYDDNGNLKHLNNPYRFVFLYACSCAGYPDWRRAFGIMPLVSCEAAEIHYGLGPQAFVGWGTSTQSPTAPIFNGTFSLSSIFEILEDSPGSNVNVEKTEETAWCFTQTLDNFYYDWMWGEPLAGCIYNAANPGNGQYPFPLPGNTKYTLATVGGPFGPFNFTVEHRWTAPLYVIGHSGLTRTSYMPQYDNLYHHSAQY